MYVAGELDDVLFGRADLVLMLRRSPSMLFSLVLEQQLDSLS